MDAPIPDLLDNGGTRFSPRADPWAITPVDLTPRNEPLPQLRIVSPEFPPGYEPEPVAVEPEPVGNLEQTGWNLPFAPPPVTRSDLLS